MVRHLAIARSGTRAIAQITPSAGRSSSRCRARADAHRNSRTDSDRRPASKAT